MNYPLDVLIGGLLGSILGETCALWVMRPVRSRGWQTMLILWVVLLSGTAVISVTVKHNSIASEAKSTRVTQKTNVFVTPPRALMPVLIPAATPGVPTIDAATNGHLLVAEIRVLLPSASATRLEVETLARNASNATFTVWPQLNLLTVSVIGIFHDGGKTHTGRLFTTTISRSEWPVTGFSLTQKLPGEKFYAHLR